MAATASTPLMPSTLSDVKSSSGGFVSEEKAMPEAETRATYFLMTIALIAIGLAIATGVYFGVGYLLPSQGELIDKKLAIVREYALEFVFLGWYICYLGRAYQTVNANGARGAARVDRPNQHVYKIMAASGPLSEAPYVMMVEDGLIGRFNRAQRACANLNESIATFITGFILQSAIFGTVTAIPVALLYAHGAYSFSNGYTKDKNNRFGGFAFMLLALYLNSSFVLLAIGLAFFKTNK